MTTTTTFSCITINGLEEVAFIAGSDYVFTFDVLDENNSPVDISTATLKWRMAYYGQTTAAVLEKTGVYSVTPINRFTVTLGKIDTENYSGKFVHQPIIIDTSAKEYRPSQGIITIIPRIGATV